MRLAHKKELTYNGNAYFYFGVLTSGGIENFSIDELTLLGRQLKRMGNQVDRVLGPNKGMIYTCEFTGERTLILRVPKDRAKSEEVRSLIGWIELFSLEDESLQSDRSDMEQRIAHIVIS